MMRNLNLSMPTHLTEALRTNLSGGKTISQLLTEAAATVSFMSYVSMKSCRIRRCAFSPCVNSAAYRRLQPLRCVRLVSNARSRSTAE